MVEDEGKKEDLFGFTPEGERIGYISLEQARVVAMRAARDDPGNYGRRFFGTRMVFDIAEQQEGEDYYVISLSFRPEGDFDGTPGREEFFIEKEGPIAYRQVRGLPTGAGERRFPVIPVAVGLVIVAIVAVAGVVLAMRDGDNGNGPPPTGEPAPTVTVKPTVTVAPVPPTTEIIVVPVGNTLSVDGTPVGPGQVAINVANGVIFLSAAPGDNGTYSDDFEITLEARPDLAGSEIVWSGVDSHSETVASVTMAADRSVTVSIVAPQACARLEQNTQYAGSIFNDAAAIEAEIDATFTQAGCKVTGFLRIRSIRLAGSGPLEGSLEGDRLQFRTLGETNDIGMDLVFDATVVDGELDGGFFVPVTGEEGSWFLVSQGTRPPDYPALLQNDHGHHMGIATSILPGSMFGTIDPPSDVDLFRFFAEEGQSYTVEVSLDTHPDTLLTIYDPDGFFLEENDDARGLGTGSRITWTAPLSGDYFFEVRSPNQDNETGSYVVNLTSFQDDDHGDTLETATTVFLGSSSGLINPPSDIDVFRFFAEADTSYMAEVFLDGHPDTFLILVDDQGELVDENDDADDLGLGSRTVWTTPPVASEYFLAVGSSDQEFGTGSYVLSLTSFQDDDHGDTLETATSIFLGSTPGIIDPPSDLDFFTYFVLGGESFTIEVFLDNHRDTQLTLYDPDGFFLEENDDAEGLDGGSRITWTAPFTGDYFFEVRSFNQSIQTGSYTLFIDRAREAPLSGFYSGEITNFEDGGTGRLELDLEESRGFVNGFLALFDPHVGTGELEPGASYSENFLEFTVVSSFQGVTFVCDYFADAFPDQGELEGQYECFLDDGTFMDNGQWSAFRQ